MSVKTKSPAKSFRTPREKRPPINHNFDSWFVGFVDAGASFDIDSYLCPTLMMRRRADDLPVLREIAKRFGGTVSVVSGGRKGDNDLAQWRIGMSQDLLPLIDAIETVGLRSRTRKHFAIWIKAVNERLKEQTDIAKMNRYRDQLRDVKKL